MELYGVVGDFFDVDYGMGEVGFVIVGFVDEGDGFFCSYMD